MSRHSHRQPARAFPARCAGQCVLPLLIVSALEGFPVLAQEPSISMAAQVLEQPSEPTPPSTIDQSSLGLGEAVLLTLKLDPQIQLEKQSLAAALGQLRQSGGSFDPILGLEAAYSHTVQENLPGVISQQLDRRNKLRALATAFGELNEEISEALEQDTLEFPTCPDDIELEEVNILEGRNILQGPGPGSRDVFIVRLGGLGQEAEEIFGVCVRRDDTGARPDNIRKVLEDLGLNEITVELAELQRQRLLLAQNIAEAVTTKAQLSLDRIGEVPRDEKTRTVSFEMNLLKPLRNGVQLGADLRLQSSERNFDDKSLDPAFGGLGVRNQFPSLAAVSLEIPLAKGRGRVSASASERAAERSVEARRELVRHTMLNEVFGTTIAYLDLVAAQETLALVEESAARQQRLVELTRNLFEAGDAAAADLDRAMARASTVSGAVADARLAVLDSRLVLANAIGLEVEGLENAPLAANGFGETLAPVEPVAQLLDQAVRGRRDLKAAEHVQESTRILARAAKADLKRTLDLSIRGGLSTLYESPFFRHLPDELDELPTESAARFYDLDGFWRSIDESWKPFVRVGLKLDFPLRNSAAEGILLQRESSLEQREIELVDLERRIRDNIVDVAGAVERARQEVEQRRSAIDYYRVTLDFALTRFRDGEISLIDALTTEEDLTQEKLQLVRAMQRFLNLAVRLHFEVGSLISFDAVGTAAETVSFEPLTFVARRLE